MMKRRIVNLFKNLSHTGSYGSRHSSSRLVPHHERGTKPARPEEPAGRLEGFVRGFERNLLLLSFLSVTLWPLPACNTYQPKSGTVIILNGPPATGKSSIIRAIQAKQEKPWLSVGIDNFFVAVLPQKFYLEDKPEHYTVMQGIATENEQGKLFTIYFGEEGRKVMNGMHGAIAAYALAGNNVLVDYILYEKEWLGKLQCALHGINVIFVGITASLPVLELREKTRGTSPEGHTRSVYDIVHQGMKYDLEINTDTITPEQAADMIINYLNKTNLNV